MALTRWHFRSRRTLLTVLSSLLPSNYRIGFFVLAHIYAAYAVERETHTGIWYQRLILLSGIVAVASEVASDQAVAFISVSR